MRNVQFPVIDPAATGRNIIRLRKERGLTVRDIQNFFGFEEPRAIYKWQRGESLPTVDNLFALGKLLGVPMEDILIPLGTEKPVYKKQQVAACCSFMLFSVGCSGYGRTTACRSHFTGLRCRNAAKRRMRQTRPGAKTLIRESETGEPVFRHIRRWRGGNAGTDSG